MQRREKGTGTVYRRDNGTWVGRMNLGRGEDGKIKYKCVSGKSEAEVKRKIRELCRRDPTQNREIRLALEKDGQSPLMDETMSVSGDWTNYSYDFTVSSAASDVKLVFMLGNVGTTENMAHTISIDDISSYKVS